MDLLLKLQELTVNWIIPTTRINSKLDHPNIQNKFRTKIRKNNK